MKGLGVFIGVVVLVFLGIPALIGVTWVTGMTRTVFSDDFFTDVSAKVVERLPGMIESSFEAAREGAVETDPESKKWIDAMTKVKTPLPEVLKKAGVFLWLEKQVAGTLLEAGQAMRGEVPPEGIHMDMRPLKVALTSEVMLAYIAELLAELPACDENGLEAWKQRALSTKHDDPFPACNPGEEAVSRAREVITLRVAGIPDMKPVFDDAEQIPPFDVARTVNSIVWLLFLVPLVLIAIGAAFAGTGGRGFLGWSGGAILAGGLISLLLAALAGGYLVSLIQIDPTYWQTGQEAFWNTGAGRLFAREMVVMVNDLMGELFSPVVLLSVFVSVFGLALIVLSRMIGKREPEPFFQESV